MASTELLNSLQEVKNKIIEEEVNKLQSITNDIDMLKEEGKLIWEQYRELTYGKEKEELGEKKDQNRNLLSVREKQLISQQNIVKAISNGGTLYGFKDKKGGYHTNVPNFVGVSTNSFMFDEDNILEMPTPPYIAVINEDIFRQKGYLFDAIRIDKDTYLLSIQGYDNDMPISLFDYSPYVIVSLEQLVLIQDYYFQKAKAYNELKAEESNKRNEKYWDSLSEQRRESFLNQKGLYHSLPVKIKKTITIQEYESLSWQEKEKIYKFYKRTGAKRLSSKLEENSMWRSFHYMYERFINPEAIMPKPKTANPEAFRYWEKFREMMDFMIKDIRIQREDYSETYKQAIETSYGESNTNISLKSKYGILVKRQDGKTIMATEIDQIADSWGKLNSVFGNLKGIADNYNLKISHSGQRNSFASKAIGVFVPSMLTIGVSNKYGNSQFESTFAHETGHFIDYVIGQSKGKRYATDNYEDTAGVIAFTFRNLMNKPKQKQTDYINSTKECFARAMQQYYGFMLYGDDAVISHSYTELSKTMPIFNADDYVGKQNFKTEIAPLIEKFLEENRDILPIKINFEPKKELSDKQETQEAINMLKELLEFQEGAERLETEEAISLLMELINL